ncbi:20166_t:CDS:2, partial [Gigaspora margarita]
NTLLETSELPEEEMKAEPSDPLRYELLALYVRTKDNEKPQGDNVRKARLIAKKKSKRTVPYKNSKGEPIKLLDWEHKPFM